MASIFTFFRVIFFYALYFLLCMVAVVTVLQGWPVGGQMLFAFGLPIVLVWWQEKKRSRKVEAKALAAESANTRATQSEPVARVSAQETRIERERERIREANAIQSSSKRRANHQNKTMQKSCVLVSLPRQHFPPLLHGTKTRDPRLKRSNQIPARMAGYLQQRQRLLLDEILVEWSMSARRYYSITMAIATNAGPTSTRHFL